MNVVKYQALGNDYLVVDLNSNLKFTQEHAKLLCNRNFGIGSDGVLLRSTQVEDPFQLTIYNPDGNIAEKSGNGLRIFTKYLFDYVEKRKQYSIEVSGQKVDAFIQDLSGETIKVNMGKAEFYPAKIPMKIEGDSSLNIPVEIGEHQVLINGVSMGNPHCVIQLEEINESLARQIGPLLEVHQIFPNRTNVQLAKVIDRNTVQIEIWERGAGYTMASGSSSCGTVSVLHRKGLVNNNVKVLMPGGALFIEIDRTTQEVWMTGGVEKVFEVNLSNALKSKLNW